MHVDISQYRNRHTLKNKIGRLLWNIVWVLLFRCTPNAMNAWRVFLLRMFGARVGRYCVVKPSCRIWAPWNLAMGDYSCLGSGVNCYAVDAVVLQSNVTVSQQAFLCTASHDIADPHMELVTAPIFIGEGAWVAALAFVGPGVRIGAGAVVGACAVVTKAVAGERTGATAGGISVQARRLRS